MNEKKESVAKEFSSRTTLHGFRYLFEERGIKWLLWLSVTLASLGISVILFKNSIQDFITYKTYTVHETNHQASEADFPTITLCSLNPVSKTKIESALGDFDIDFHDFLHYAQAFDGSAKDKITEKKIENMTVELNLTSAQYLAMYQISMKDMIGRGAVGSISRGTFCKFNDEICNLRNFTQTVKWPQNLCYQFNAYESHINRSLKITKPGIMKNGLTLYLDLHSNETSDMDIPYKGIEIFIHPYGSLHFLSEHTANLIIQPGSMSSIVLKQGTVKLLEAPFVSACGKKDYSVIKNYPYSYSSCIIDCLLAKVYEICGCIGFEMENYLDSDINVCSFKSMHCYQNFTDRLFDGGYVQLCRKNCPLDCLRTSYTFQASQATLGSHLVYRKLGTRLNMSYQESARFVSASLIGIHIAFDSLSQTTETMTESVTLTGLFGLIGGSIGLCFGFSIITGVEFVLFIIDLMKDFCQKAVNNSVASRK